MYCADVDEGTECVYLAKVDRSIHDYVMLFQECMCTNVCETSINIKFDFILRTLSEHRINYSLRCLVKHVAPSQNWNVTDCIISFYEFDS